MRIEPLVSTPGEYNLVDYDTEKQNFNWESVKQAFSWEKTGKINMAYETIDRHAESNKANRVALYYEDENRKEAYTFEEMKKWTNKAANVFSNYSELKKGDRLFIFMPRSPELYFSMFGALKMGVIVGPLFEAFMEEAVFDRLEDSEATDLVTTSELLKRVPLARLRKLKNVFVVGEQVEESAKIIDFNKRLLEASENFAIEWLTLEDGLVLHYTSGSTGKPKGVLHVQNAMIQHYQTAKWALDFKDDDLYWCTADPGWVTGTAYGVFAPWLHGISLVIVGGRFSHQAWYHALESYKITVWYSAPTAFRMLMGAGSHYVEQYDLSALRHIVSVGEPLNPEVIKWGNEVFHLRIHDTWWMTETGGQMVCNYPAMDIKPGSMGKPIPGVEVAIIDDLGNEVPAFTMGNLAIKIGWPSMMRQIWNNPTKYESYFINGEWYISGDSAYVDNDGYFWFQGRKDDLIMTSGERVGPFEVESKLLEHPAVLEAGVIGKPDPIRGEIIKAFISLNEGFEESEQLAEELKLFVKTSLAANVVPREIEFKEKLPKTRSGKIMRRVLKAWELDLPTGDMSTLED